jgi:parallel beta-helix repeat protein
MKDRDKIAPKSVGFHFENCEGIELHNNSVEGADIGYSFTRGKGINASNNTFSKTGMNLPASYSWWKRHQAPK